MASQFQPCQTGPSLIVLPSATQPGEELMSDMSFKIAFAVFAPGLTA